jgi:hypothetical protein
MSFDRGERTSLFGALRPGSGQVVTRAVVATYSVDLVALLGLVLALGGHGEEEFDTGPLGLVDAFETMRGRLLVLHQQGRAVAPARYRTLLHLLDNMVEAVPANERTRSWHPKVALVRYEDVQVPEWRFWIGSRNLTGSTDLDAGLLLIGRARGRGRVIPAIADLASDLLSAARWDARHVEELRAMQWLAPAGLVVHDLLWRSVGQHRTFRLPPGGLRVERRIVAVSPFLEPSQVEELQSSAAGGLTLLTSRRAALDIPDQQGLDLRIAASPLPQSDVVLPTEAEEADLEFIEVPTPGVHAKLVMQIAGRRRHLMLGSANLTRRGLRGPNAEAAVILELKDESLAQSLEAFVKGFAPLLSREVDPAELAKEGTQRELDMRVSDLLEIPFTLHVDAEGVTLRAGKSLDAFLSDLRFEVELFSRPGDRRAWSIGANALGLAESPPAEHENTALVIMHATSLSEPIVMRSWTHRVDFADLDVDRRDRALLANYVGAARFRLWLRGVLDGIEGEAGRWLDGLDTTAPERPIPAGLPDLFTLETMLAKWARSPVEFEVRIGRMSALIGAFRAAFEALPEGDERERALADLDDVAPFLDALVLCVEEPIR